MVITITTKKFNLTDELRERIDKKLQKLDRYFHTDAEAAVRLYTQRATEVAEVTVLHNGMQFRAEGRTGEMFHSVEEKG